MTLKGKKIAFNRYNDSYNKSRKADLSVFLKSCGCVLQSQADAETDYIIWFLKLGEDARRVINANAKAGRVTEACRADEFENRFLDLSESGHELADFRQYFAFHILPNGTLSLDGGSVERPDPASDEIVPPQKEQYDFPADFTGFTLNGIEVLKPLPGGGVRLQIPARVGGRAVSTIAKLPYRWLVTELVLPDAPVNTGYKAAQYAAVTSLTVPAGIRSIGDYAFFHCEHLQSVTFDGPVPELGTNSFAGCPKFADENGNIILQNHFFGFTDRRHLRLPEGVVNRFRLAPFRVHDRYDPSPTDRYGYPRFGMENFRREPWAEWGSSWTDALMDAETLEGPAEDLDAILTACDAASHDGAADEATRFVRLHLAELWLGGGLRLTGNKAPFEKKLRSLLVKKRSQLLHGYLEKSDTAKIAALLGVLGKLPAEEYDSYISLTGETGSTEAHALFLQAKAQHYSQADLDRLEERKIDVEFGLAEPSTADWRKIFRFNNDGVIIEYLGEDPVVTIPDRIGNVRITAIGDKAFYENKTLEAVHLPAGLQSIGIYAFAECPHLRQITLPSACLLIADHAFRNCKALESVTLPDAGTVIFFGAFAGCTALREVITAPGADYTVSQSAFPTNQVTLPEKVLSPFYLYWHREHSGLNRHKIRNPRDFTGIVVDGAAVCRTHVVFPARIAGQPIIYSNYIDYRNPHKWKFDGIESAVIEDGAMKVLPDCLFSGCASLKEVRLPEGLKGLGSCAFNGTAVEELTVPRSVAGIDSSALSGMAHLKKLNVENPNCKISPTALSDFPELADENGFVFIHGHLAGITSKHEQTTKDVLELPAGTIVDYCSGLPKIWYQPSPGGEVQPQPAAIGPVGTVCQFGRFPQSADGLLQPISWKVLARTEDAALLRAESVLAALSSVDIKEGRLDYLDFPKWANNGFYRFAFTKDERKRILPVEESLLCAAGIREKDLQPPRPNDKVLAFAPEESSPLTEYAKKQSCLSTGLYFRPVICIALNQK